MALALLFVLGAPARAQEVVGHAALAADLTRAQLRELFMMRRRQLPDRSPAWVFVLPDDHPVHERFVRAILGLYPRNLRQLWDRHLYSGTAQPPIEVQTETRMLQRIATTPGAIGYVGHFTGYPGVQRIGVR